MRTTRLRTAAALLALVLVAAAGNGCLRYSVSGGSSTHGHGYGSSGGQGHGPPDWAPAHGRRAKHPSGVHLDFDAAVGVYLVVEYPGMYFHAERFYWNDGGTWSVSAGAQGPWSVIPNDQLPPGLRKSSRGKKPSYGHPGKRGR